MLTKFLKWPTLPGMAKKAKKVAKRPSAKNKPAMKAKKAAKPAKIAKPKANAKAAKAAKTAKGLGSKAHPPAKAAAKVAKPVKAAKPAAPRPQVKAAAAAAPKAQMPKGKAKVNGKAAEAKAPAIQEIPLEAVETPEGEGTPEVVLTDAEGRRYCRVKDCDQLASVDSYCRYHYLLYWKRIQIRKKILGEGKLERYIEELTARYPDKFLDMLRKDLSNEKEFLMAIQELEIDESQGEGAFEDESENFIDEVRGISEPAAREEDEGF